MATKSKASPPAAPAPTYDPDALYDVRLNRVVMDSPVGALSPGKENHLRGWICTAIADAIADATLIAE